MKTEFKQTSRRSVSVASDIVVTLAYAIYDSAGKLVEEVTREDALTYVHGHAQLIAGLEAALEGCRLGERRRIELPPCEAFGERDESARMEIDRVDTRACQSIEAIELGGELILEDPDGCEVRVRVLDLSEDRILVDMNHPLAGQALRFETEICGLRPATEAEIDRVQAELAGRIADAGMIVYGGAGAPERQNLLVQLRRTRGSPKTRDEERL